MSLTSSQGGGGLVVSERTGSEELVVTEATGSKQKGSFPYPEVSKIAVHFSKLKEGFHSQVRNCIVVKFQLVSLKKCRNIFC